MTEVKRGHLTEEEKDFITILHAKIIKKCY